MILKQKKLCVCNTLACYLKVFYHFEWLHLAETILPSVRLLHLTTKILTGARSCTNLTPIATIQNSRIRKRVEYIRRLLVIIPHVPTIITLSISFNRITHQSHDVPLALLSLIQGRDTTAKQ